MGYDKHQAFIDALLNYLWEKRKLKWDEYNRRILAYRNSIEDPQKFGKVQKPSISEYNIEADGFLKIFLHVRDILYNQDEQDEKKKIEPHHLPVITDKMRISLKEEFKEIFKKHNENMPGHLAEVI